MHGVRGLDGGQRIEVLDKKLGEICLGGAVMDRPILSVTRVKIIKTPVQNGKVILKTSLLLVAWNSPPVRIEPPPRH
jgi:hypothetical protein